MNKQELIIYDAVKSSIEHTIPKLLESVIQIQSKVDNLPDFPSLQEVGAAIGISSSMVRKYIKDLQIDEVYLKKGRTRRIHKADFVKIIIHDTYNQKIRR